MFEKYKAQKAEEKSNAEVARSLSAKRAAEKDTADQISELQELISLASGNSSASVDALILKKDEIGLAQITNVGLIEDRKGAGQWKGSSQGVSFPIGRVAGRSVRYRVGATRGHYVQGAPVPTAIDRGTLSITNHRIVFQGSKKSSECLFSKLLGIQHGVGALSISVSNRQKPTNVHFGDKLDDWVSNRLSIALALFNDDASEILSQLQAQVVELESGKNE